MVIFFYLAVIITGFYSVSKVLLPEMAKPPLPSQRPVPKRVIPKQKSIEIVQSQSSDPDARLKKLETLLAEKNKNINLLQSELRIFHIQVRDSDKIKSLLEDEVHRLREQNRIFRSELGLPAVQSIVQSAENLIT
jgi:hypothetical protein